MKNFIAKDQKIDYVNNKLYTTINIPYSTIHAVNVSRIENSEVSRRGLSNNFKHYCNLEITTPNKIENFTVAEHEGLGTLVNEFTNICHLSTIEDNIKHQKLINSLKTKCEALPTIYFSDIKSFEATETKSFETTDGELICNLLFNVRIHFNESHSNKELKLSEEKYLSFIKHFSLYKKYQHNLQKNIPNPIYTNHYTFVVYAHIETHSIKECMNSDNKKGANVDIVFKNNDKNLTMFLDDDNLKYFIKGQKEWEDYIMELNSSNEI
jgi:hypothetical protein